MDTNVITKTIESSSEIPTEITHGLDMMSNAQQRPAGNRLTVNKGGGGRQTVFGGSVHVPGASIRNVRLDKRLHDKTMANLEKQWKLEVKQNYRRRLSLRKNLLKLRQEATEPTFTTLEKNGSLKGEDLKYYRQMNHNKVKEVPGYVPSFFNSNIKEARSLPDLTDSNERRSRSNSRKKSPTSSRTSSLDRRTHRRNNFNGTDIKKAEISDIPDMKDTVTKTYQNDSESDVISMPEKYYLLASRRRSRSMNDLRIVQDFLRSDSENGLKNKIEKNQPELLCPPTLTRHRSSTVSDPNDSSETLLTWFETERKFADRNIEKSLKVDENENEEIKEEKKIEKKSNYIMDRRTTFEDILKTAKNKLKDYRQLQHEKILQSFFPKVIESSSGSDTDSSVKSFSRSARRRNKTPKRTDNNIRTGSSLPADDNISTHGQPYPSPPSSPRTVPKSKYYRRTFKKSDVIADNRMNTESTQADSA